MHAWTGQRTGTGLRQRGVFAWALPLVVSRGDSTALLSARGVFSECSSYQKVWTNRTSGIPLVAVMLYHVPHLLLDTGALKQVAGKAKSPPLPRRGLRLSRRLFQSTVFSKRFMGKAQRGDAR